MACVEIRLITGEVCVDGQAIDLTEKELHLIFTVAACGTINGEQLMDMLWPDADGDAAHNAFRVCLHRLRKRVAHTRVIKRAGKAYAVDDGVAVDIADFREAMARCSGPSDRDAAVERFVSSVREGHECRARLGSWFEPFERLLWTYARRCHTCRASDLVTVR